MTTLWRTGTLLCLLLGIALPVYANNPPQPDGLFSVLLVFPIVILGARFAAVAARPRKLSARIIGGVAVFVLTTVVLAAGTALGALAALVVLVYGIVRASQIMQQGTGTKRFAIAVGVGIFALFAFADYYASIVTAYPSSAIAESSAVACLRSLRAAESDFAQRGQTVGTIKDLERAQLIEDILSDGRIRKGYRYGAFVDSARKEYVFYAIPAAELKPASSQVNFVPGASLIKSIFGARQDQQTGVRSFSVDNNGLFRWSIRKNPGPVTEEEVRQWELLQ